MNNIPVVGKPHCVHAMDEDNITYRCVFNEEFKYILLPVCYGIVFCVGFVLNVLALYIFIFRIRPWKTVNVFMFNLALSDLLYVLSLPLLVHYYSKANDWPFSEVLCKLVRFLFYTSLYCSIFFLLCISICRFLAICYPIRFLTWGHIRYAKVVSAAIWVVVIIMQSPICYFVTTSQFEDTTICHDTSSTDLFDQFVVFSTVNLALLFCVPFTVILVCYSYMVYILTKRSSNIAQVAASKKKSIKMIVIVFLVFATCFLPFHVTRTLYYYFRKMDLDCHVLDAINVAYKVTRPLASMNSCIDPVLYFLVWRFRFNNNNNNNNNR
ncbi:P2Y purinoceptor 2-like [Spea bombifrons]|uniref:P2Y purinoceptor 2-like n=1 Tax=Spea bombifrons TaxID=233779 RepID=UPI00234B8E96|nr:P2Y purinoceptor 2-like [Spea bombifrons]